MKLSLVEWNVQDFFLQLEYPISETALAGLSDQEWALLAKADQPLKPLSKIKAIASVIEELDADIVFLCEVGGLESLENFARLFLADRYEALLVPGNSNRGIESGFLVRRSLGLECRVKSHRSWPMPFQYPHEIDPVLYRLAAEAAPYYELGRPEDRRLSRDIPSLTIKKSGATLAVFLLVHLKSGFDTAGVDKEGTVRRAAELKALLAIREAAQQKLPAVPIFMTGDFNGQAGRTYTAPEFLPLYRETAYDDALEIVGLPLYERITHLTFIRRELFSKQLDFFFVPPSMRSKIEEAFVYRYHEDEEEKMLPLSFRERWELPSDHYPLVVRLSL